MPNSIDFYKMIFLTCCSCSYKNHAGIEAGRLVPDLFWFFKKSLHEIKASGQQLGFNIL